MIPEPECPDCGHPVRLHEAQYGCQYERGDKWVDSERMGGWVAQGPCGCKSVTNHRDTRDDNDNRFDFQRENPRED